MQQSNDMVILDQDPIQPLQINQSKLKFDDILNKSEQIVKSKQSKPRKMPKMPKTDHKVQKQTEKIAKTLETAITEPERQNLVYIIQKYQSSERFGKYIRSELKINYTAESLNKKSVQQLESILNKIRLNLDNKNLNKVYDSVLFGGTTLLESVSRPVANVDGFSEMLLHNEEFLNCWERFKCESVMPTIPAPMQMMFIIAQTYLMAYTVNKYKPSEESKQLVAEIQKEIDQEQIDRQNSKTVEKTDTETDTKTESEPEIIEKPTIMNGMNI